mmetsp:Transcript_21115/g.32292  ORF Transcript_21115/g.32292 Transcript_21115/m.32292 type:complete len:224 (+) Transcript_21115:2012-2683(+)
MPYSSSAWSCKAVGSAAPPENASPTSSTALPLSAAIRLRREPTAIFASCCLKAARETPNAARSRRRRRDEWLNTHGAKEGAVVHQSGNAPETTVKGSCNCLTSFDVNDFDTNKRFGRPSTSLNSDSRSALSCICDAEKCAKSDNSSIHCRHLLLIPSQSDWIDRALALENDRISVFASSTGSCHARCKGRSSCKLRAPNMFERPSTEGHNDGIGGGRPAPAGA